MNDSVADYCESVRAKLDALEGRMESLKLNIGTTWHSLQQRLGEVRQQHTTSRRSLAEARSKLEQWFNENTAGNRSSIDQWITNRDTEQLEARAQLTEAAAWTAITLAEASIDDAERLILEAISAKLDTKAVSHH